MLLLVGGWIRPTVGLSNCILDFVKFALSSPQQKAPSFLLQVEISKPYLIYKPYQINFFENTLIDLYFIK